MNSWKKKKMETVGLHGQETKLQASAGAATVEVNLRGVAGANTVRDRK